ncbi:kinase phosphorylation protein-domain-containing protein [Lactarius pseudohatsudake]|nr:kinase phosphorylation protein-domain-containing protein [Lactarius pseudohatsudake]
MFEPIRGGTRGGQAEFKWSDVSADKDRENYLGHSTNAPTGRWQKNKDIHWYSRDLKTSEEERAEEIRKIKEAEAEALSVALGFGPSKKEGSSSTPGTGTNAIPVPARTVADADVDPDAAVKAAEKAERKRRRAERREDKAARKPKLWHARSNTTRARANAVTIPHRDDSRGRKYQFPRDRHSPRSDRHRDTDRDRSRSPHRREFNRRSELPPRRLSPNDRYDGPGPERSRDRERRNHNARR